MNRPVLVVAPDFGLRRSIAFVLEVEGLDVLSVERLSDLPAPAEGAAAACVIVDAEAVRSDPAGLQRLSELSNPVILLVDRLGEFPEAGVRVLRKPLLGRSLVEAVAVARARPLPIT